jgi:hypothetical protein
MIIKLVDPCFITCDDTAQNVILPLQKVLANCDSSCLCSSVSSFVTIFAHTFLVSKSSVKIFLTSNCNITLHVSDAFCVHPQEYLKTVVAASGVCHVASYKTNINKCCVYICCIRVTGLMLFYGYYG